MNAIDAAHHPVLNALTNAFVGLGYLATWGLLALVIVAACAMLLLSMTAPDAQASQGDTSKALVSTHRIEAVAVHGEDGDRYVAVKVVGLSCPVAMRATVYQLAESAQANGYSVAMGATGDEVHVRPNYSRLAY